MNIFLPDRHQVHELQRHEGRFYWSAALDLILRKHGLIPSEMCWGAEGDPSPFGFVGRNTPWRDEFDDGALIFEGPLHSTTARALGLMPSSHEAEVLELHSPQGSSLGELRFVRTMMRHIPAAGTTEPQSMRPYTNEDSRWSPRSFGYQAFTDGSTPWLLAKSSMDNHSIVGVAVGRHLVAGVPIFDVAVQAHAVPPYDGGSYFTVAAAPILEPLEEWIVSSASKLLRKSERISLRIGSWPSPFAAAFTIRHDFDRPMDNDSRKHHRQRRALRRLLRFYSRQKVVATWFWRRRSFSDKIASRVQRIGHEIALHTEACDQHGFEEELHWLASRAGVEIAGYTVHGGRGSAGYLGLHQIGWAQAAGLSYGEALSAPDGFRPFLAVTLQNGVPAVAPFVLHSRHWSLDTGMGPDDHLLSQVLVECDRLLRGGHHVVVMNHPDIHLEELRLLIKGLDLDKTWRATLAQIARWVRATHFGVARIEGSDSVDLEFRDPLPHDAVIAIGRADSVDEIVAPAGTCRVIVSRAGLGQTAVTESGSRVSLESRRTPELVTISSS